MYGSAAAGGGSGGGGGGAQSSLSSAAPDFAPAHSRAIRIVNPDDPHHSTPASPSRRHNASNQNTSGAGKSGNNSGGGGGGGGAAPSRWSRAAAIPSFQPRDASSQQDSVSQLGPPPGLGGTAALSARNVAAPVFVPKQRGAGSSAPPGLSSQPSQQQQQAYDSYMPSHMQQQPSQQQQQGGGYPSAAMMSQAASQNPYSSALPSPSINPYAMGPPGMSPAGGPPASLVGGPPGSMMPPGAMLPGGPGSGGPTLGGLSMQAQQQQQQAHHPAYQPPLYHLYAPALPHISNLSPHHFALHSFFMSPGLREELQRKNEAIRAAALPVPGPAEASGSSAGVKALPEELHVYHSLIPLEPLGAGGAALADIHPALVPGSAGGPSGTGSGAGGSSGGGGAGAGASSNGGLGINSSTTMSGEPSKVFGYRTHVYRAICRLDGKAYALRRLEGFRLQYEAAIALVERWRRVRHPGVVCVREAFTTRAFGDSSIVFVSDYHPLASNLLQEYLHPKPPRIDPRTNRLQAVNMQIPERTLWSYIVQLSSALRAVHRAGLAVRCLEASKVLQTGKNRIRIGGCSIFDVLQYDPQSPPSTTTTTTPSPKLLRQQAEDLYALGILVLQLSTNSLTAAMNPSTIQRSLELIARNYSGEMRELCGWLLDARPGASASGGGEDGEEGENQSSLRTVVQLEAILAGFSSPSAMRSQGGAVGVAAAAAAARSPSVSSRGGGGHEHSGPSNSWRRGGGGRSNNAASSSSQDAAHNHYKDGSLAAGDKGPPNRCAEELDAALNWGDLLEGELMKETENARLVRLVCKLGLINERPEFDHDPRWSETGDRYIIKLFRDYVFHAVDPETGQPVVDLSYILTNLNKLDAGSDEKIVLTSRDEQSCLVVSYRDIKNCIENAFKDLARAR